MNEEQTKLAKQLAAHPRFEWRAGMRPVFIPSPFVWSIDRVAEDGWRPSSCDDIQLDGGYPDGKREAWPDLRDDATAGCLLVMLSRIPDGIHARLVDGLAKVVWVSEAGNECLSLRLKPIGEVAARTLLNVWGAQ